MGFEGIHLQRVLTVPDPGGDPELRIHSVELYRDGVIVRWLQRHDDPEKPGTLPAPPPQGEFLPTRTAMKLPDVELVEDRAMEEPAGIAISDDLKTTYLRTRSGSTGGTSQWLRGEDWFVPPVPSAATRLALALGPVSVELDLD